jgi:hypothetical protein
MTPCHEYGQEESLMFTVVKNAVGMVNTVSSRLLLREIFPNYPDLNPCLPLPKWAKEQLNVR